MTLHAADLPPLLDILADPAHPAFPHALARLTEFNPATLSATTAPALLAQLQTTLNQLAAAKHLTTTQLAALRRTNTALTSYTTNLK